MMTISNAMPRGRNFATDIGDIMKQGLRARIAPPACCSRDRTFMNRFSLTLSALMSAISVQFFCGPPQLPAGAMRPESAW